MLYSDYDFSLLSDESGIEPTHQALLKELIELPRFPLVKINNTEMWAALINKTLYDKTFIMRSNPLSVYRNGRMIGVNFGNSIYIAVECILLNPNMEEVERERMVKSKTL